MLIAAILVSSVNLFAQEESENLISISGMVCSEDGEPIIGAVIREYKTGNTTSTDLDGNFTIYVNDKSSIVEVSSIGFKNMYLRTHYDFSKVVMIKDFKDRKFYLNAGLVNEGMSFENDNGLGKLKSSSGFDIKVGRMFYITKYSGLKTIRCALLADIGYSEASFSNSRYAVDESSVNFSAGPAIAYRPSRLVNTVGYLKITSSSSELISEPLSGNKVSVSLGAEFSYGIIGVGLEYSHNMSSYQKYNGYINAKGNAFKTYLSFKLF